MSETTAPERPQEETAGAVAAPEARASVGTPVFVWVVYVLGALAGTILLGSLAFVAFGYLAAGSGEAGVDVSMPALVVWLALALAGGCTFVWRRWGKAR